MQKRPFFYFKYVSLFWQKLQKIILYYREDFIKDKTAGKLREIMFFLSCKMKVVIFGQGIPRFELFSTSITSEIVSPQKGNPFYI